MAMMALRGGGVGAPGTWESVGPGRVCGVSMGHKTGNRIVKGATGRRVELIGRGCERMGGSRGDAAEDVGGGESNWGRDVPRKVRIGLYGKVCQRKVA